MQPSEKDHDVGGGKKGTRVLIIRKSRFTTTTISRVRFVFVIGIVVLALCIVARHRNVLLLEHDDSNGEASNNIDLPRIAARRSDAKKSKEADRFLRSDNKVPVTAWPYCEYGLRSAESLHTIHNGIAESAYLKLENNMFSLDPRIVWVGDITYPFDENDEWCNEYYKRVLVVKEFRAKRGLLQQWPIHLVDFTDRGRYERCRNIEGLVGRNFVSYYKRAVVDGRRWNKKIDWVNVGALNTPESHGVLPLPVRTDIVEETSRVLIGKKRYNLTLKDSIESLAERPIDVSHFWPLNVSSGGSVSEIHSNLRCRVSRIIDDLGKRSNLNVFVGIAGQGLKTGRQTAQTAYVEKMIESKIVVVTQRDGWQDHYKFFEALVSGAMVMTDVMLGMPEGLINGKSIIEYSSEGDLRSKILYYLKNPNERIRIAQKGRFAAMNQHRTWHHIEKVIFGKPMTTCNSNPNTQNNNTNNSDDDDCPWNVHSSDGLPNPIKDHELSEKATKTKSILWLVIPSSDMGGKKMSTLFNVFYLHFCPRILRIHPELSRGDPPNDPDFMFYNLIENYPPDDHCDVHFHNMPRVQKPLPRVNMSAHFDEGNRESSSLLIFATIRDPLKRLLVDFKRSKHKKKKWQDFVREEGIPNCQTKVLLGYTCRDAVDPSELNLPLAIERIESENFFFGIEDRWYETMCLFHNWYGGSIQYYENHNNNIPPASHHADEATHYRDLDSILFWHATDIFERRLEEAGCLLHRNIVKKIGSNTPEDGSAVVHPLVERKKGKPKPDHLQLRSKNDKIPVVPWPFCEYGLKSSESVHTIHNGISESAYLRLENNMFNLDPNVVWVGDTTYYDRTDYFCDNLYRRVFAAKEFRARRGLLRQWPIHLVDSTDKGRYFTCENVESLVGREFLSYHKRPVVAGRKWNDKTDWVDLGELKTPESHGVLPLPVRTDIVEETSRVLLGKKRHNLTLKDSIESLAERPIDVSHFWPRNVSLGGLVSPTNSNLRCRVSRIIDDLGKRSNLSVFVGIAGQGLKTGRQTAQTAYVEKMIESKIVVVTQRDGWQDHYKFFEALVSGAMVMTDAMLGMPEGLIDGKSIIEYSSEGDLRSKILYYLKNPNERIRIAKKGRFAAMNQHRTWHHIEKVIFGKPMTTCNSNPNNQNNNTNKGDDNCPWNVHSDGLPNPIKGHELSEKAIKKKNIMWLVIPSYDMGGKEMSALFNVFYLHFCPRILEAHPELSRGDQPNNLAFMFYDLIRDYPPDVYCDVHFQNMPRVQRSLPAVVTSAHFEGNREESSLIFATIRDPLKRVLGDFKRSAHVNFQDFLRADNIPNCQTRVLSGYEGTACSKTVDSSKLNVSLAIERIESENFFFGIADRWYETMCLFHDWYGGSTQYYENHHNFVPETSPADSPNDYEDLDSVLFRRATIIFERRLEEAGCLLYYPNGT